MTTRRRPHSTVAHQPFPSLNVQVHDSRRVTLLARARPRETRAACATLPQPAPRPPRRFAERTLRASRPTSEFCAPTHHPCFTRLFGVAANLRGFVAAAPFLGARPAPVAWLFFSLLVAGFFFSFLFLAVSARFFFPRGLVLSACRLPLARGPIFLFLAFARFFFSWYFLSPRSLMRGVSFSFFPCPHRAYKVFFSYGLGLSFSLL